MRIRLSDDDRERLGCPEWITYDANRLTTLEGKQLQKAGFDPPRKAIAEAWAAQFEPIDAETYRQARIDYDVYTAVVWMALRRIGIQTTYAELEFDTVGMQWELEPAPEVDGGKGPSTPPGTSSD